MSNQLTIPAEAVAAVNAVLQRCGCVHVCEPDRVLAVNLDADDVSALILALAACEPVAGLVDELDNARVLVGLLTVRQVIAAGDEAINAAGISPYCMNDGRATGDERVGTWSIDAALAPLAKGGA
jgi:hypothetical protein